MIKKGLLSLALVLPLFGGASERTSHHEITWAATISPPFHIVSGPLAQQGVCDAFVDALIDAMPTSKHKIERLPRLRIGMLWQQEKNLCYPCMIHRQEEQSLIEYSDPTYTYPSHGIITRPELVAELTSKYGNPVDLKAMLSDQSYRFGQPVGRLYGKLQPLLDEHLIGTSQHTDLAGETANTSMMSMILGNRLDFTIDYPMLKRFYEATGGRNLAFLPIAQLAGEEVIGAVACTRNSWGADTIKRINQIIPTVQNNPKFQQAQKTWLQPE
ncbi:hypothetical protein [Pseudidiomarina sp.]|uniref:hypothetical protein n=1 Tax=Pseudidiomarina sp. TaxID=2081707 RepID=UPI003A97A0D4